MGENIYSSPLVNESMEVSKTGVIVIIVLLLIVSMSPVYARDYSLDLAKAKVTVAADGTVHVTESIDYTFTGTYREVFRRVYPPPGGSIEGIEIGCTPLPCEGRVDRVSGGYELVGVLPTPTPDRIKFVISYDYLRGLKVYDDVSEFQYKLWGDEWDKALSKLRVTVELPAGGEGETTYWLHPDSYTKTAEAAGNTITVETSVIPAYTWYEIRAVFPRLETPDPSKALIINREGMAEILRVESDYAKKEGKAGKLYLLLWILTAVAITVPYYIYHKYGREPEIDYHGLYEREPPSDSKPAAVNAIMQGRIGKPDMNAFIATIMDLVYRGYIELEDRQTEKSYMGLFTRTEEDVMLKMKASGDGLLDFEADVFNFLWAYSDEGVLSWQKFKGELGRDDRFYKFINRWNKSIKRRIKVERLFESTGNYLLMAFGIGTLAIGIIGAALVLNIFPPTQFPDVKKAFVPGASLLVIGLVSFIISLLNEKGAGRFTSEGRLYYARWRNFRRYLTDYSALKEHPPESIKLWDYYMVYAVALGVAEKVIKNMSLVVPKEQMNTSSFYAFYYHPMFFTGFNQAYTSSNPSSSGGGLGGVGGVGGGFGGGGGGAR